MNEFGKQEAKFLRRTISFIRLLKYLYHLDILTPTTVHGWIKDLLTFGSDKSIEFVCMLLKAIGKSFEADTKIWMMASRDQMEISTFSDLSQYMNKLASFVEQRKTSKKVRFMMMVVLKLQANNWENKKSRYK